MPDPFEQIPISTPAANKSFEQQIRDRPATIGISIPFFCAAIKVLAKQHGEKYCGEHIERFRACLAEAELIYQEMPDVEKPTKRKPS
jgi:hypothetical protein